MKPLLATLALLLASAIAWSAFAPLEFDSREELFEIPKGTYARRMSGDPGGNPAAEVHLMLGARDRAAVEEPR